MISYYSLGSTKRLCDIVMAGSHDAGITKGAGNVKTQNVNIMLQAIAGVRVFDLRIAAGTMKGAVGPAGERVVQLRAFHADGVLQARKTKERFIADTGQTTDVKRTNLRGGAFGLGLTAMLNQAKDFVTTVAPSEFLILKFDKCTNWGAIAETCVNVLGGAIYTGAGNLNTTTLQALRGKVVVVFTADGIKETRANYTPAMGILEIKNLNGAAGGYRSNFNGLQYFGKGGTSVVKPFYKVEQNIEKQSKLMRKGGVRAVSRPQVMGMMYWTTTGLAESIKERNNDMWTGSNVTALRRTWKNGLEEAIEMRLSTYQDPTSHGAGGALQAFMPNIVMIDFADPTKCRTIYDLNAVASTALTAAAQKARAQYLANAPT